MPKGRSLGSLNIGSITPDQWAKLAKNKNSVGKSYESDSVDAGFLIFHHLQM